MTIAAVGLLAFNIIMTSSINLTASENNLGGTFTEKEQDHASLEHVNYWAVLAAPPDDGSGFISNVKHLRSLLVSTGWAEEC
ncbi:MAG TPA: hypothetical protein ENI45_04250, partial [Thermoplasmatales archaeon]|nr:hypothetical protein [Thermoplasmatales archaeon]